LGNTHRKGDAMDRKAINSRPSRLIAQDAPRELNELFSAAVQNVRLAAR
jgi:hypothetical protein